MSRLFWMFGLVFFSGITHSQTEKTIYGVIKADSAVVEGVHILNLVSEKVTVSDKNGAFSIPAKEEDLLVFSAVHLHYARKSISKKDYDLASIEVKMEVKEIQLDEVVVSEYPKINAKDLGIITYTPKVYTPAERKLHTATTGVLDPLLNWISGRTKMLKNEIEAEKKEMLLLKLNELYDTDFFAISLKIPEIYIEGFKYYIVEDSKVAVALQSKNKALTTFLLGELATEFNEFLHDENN